MRRKILFFGIGILLLSLGGWAIFKAFRPHHSVAGETAVASISALALYNDFLNSEPEANKRWVGRVIEIRGIITSVEETSNSVALNIKADGNGGINCSFMKSDADPRHDASTGDSITIVGKCTGFLADVNMVDCIIKK